MCTSHGDSGPPGHRKARGWRSTPGGAWDKRAHAAAASGSVPPGGSQRSVSTAVPATLLRARITSAVAAGVVAGRFEPPPQPVTVSAAAITAMIATVRLASMSSKTAAPHRKVPALRRPASRRIADPSFRSRIRALPPAAASPPFPGSCCFASGTDTLRCEEGVTLSVRPALPRPRWRPGSHGPKGRELRGPMNRVLHDRDADHRSHIELHSVSGHAAVWVISARRVRGGRGCRRPRWCWCRLVPPGCW